MHQLHSHWAKLCVAGLFLAACSKDQQTAPPEHAPPPAATAETGEVAADATRRQAPEAESLPAQVTEPVQSGAATMGALSDAQIMKVTETVDTGEVKQAELAQQKAKQPEVQQFAAHMISQHTKSKQQGTQLAKQLDEKPADSPLSLQLQTEGTQTLESLKMADSANFDREYIAAQIKQHQAVLEHIDDHLLPAATDPNLKAQLTQARKMVSNHLTQAKELRSKLDGQ